jgi:hypothetical protein
MLSDVRKLNVLQTNPHRQDDKEALAPNKNWGQIRVLTRLEVFRQVKIGLWWNETTGKGRQDKG